MNMQEHIIAAMKEQFDRWDDLQASLSVAQISSALLPSNWTPKDVIAHLWGWQQRSIAKLEAAAAHREPVFPTWADGFDPEEESNTAQVNEWIYQANRQRSWPEIRQDWQAGYHRLVELGAGFSEQALLDSNRYAWLDGYSLADVLIGWYDHHQEHYEMLSAWLREN